MRPAFLKAMGTGLAMAGLVPFVAACQEPEVKAEELSEPNPLSQTRLPNESFHEAERRRLGGLSNLESLAFTNVQSVRSIAVALGSEDRSEVPESESLEAVRRAFFLGRDQRILDDPERDSFKRRATWLYPDNGCYARGELMATAASDHVRVGKVFVFGDLEFQTALAKLDRVLWWYHTAPVTQVDGVYYVLDAAVQPEGPILLERWLDDIGARYGGAVVSFCDAKAYGPFSFCRAGKADDRSRAASDEVEFLIAEWERLTELGRDPWRELGDSPPWL